MNISQEELTQPILEEDVSHFTQKTNPAGKSKLDGEEIPQPPLPEMKPLPPGLKYAFLHDNRAMPVFISDKLTESETRQLVAVLEKYRSLGLAPIFAPIAFQWSRNISRHENINNDLMMR